MFFPIQATPYVRLFKRLFLGQGSLQTISYKQDILCPEEKATLRSTVFLPGQIDRVKEYKATDHWGAPTKDSEIAAATSTSDHTSPNDRLSLQRRRLIRRRDLCG